MSKKLPVELIGPFPPNVGGVSTHLSRALPLLQKQGFNVSVISVNALGAKSEPNVRYIPAYLLPIALLFKRKSCLHFHVDSLNHLILAMLLSIRHKTYLTVHNNRYPTTLLDDTFKDKIKWKCLSSFKRIICVNSVTHEFLKNRLSNVYPKVVPAFLPPIEINEASIIDIKAWGDKFEHLLSGYAYRLSFYLGQDLYGIDMMIELIERLIIQKINVGLVLLLNLEQNDYLTSLKEKIKALKLEENIQLIDINKGVDAVALWQHSDLYLRPTNTDGNSISVLEALHVGTPVVASDCVERPANCLLFKNRDIEDFTLKVIDGLSSKVSLDGEYGLYNEYY